MFCLKVDFGDMVVVLEKMLISGDLCQCIYCFCNDWFGDMVGNIDCVIFLFQFIVQGMVDIVLQVYCVVNEVKEGVGNVRELVCIQSDVMLIVVVGIEQIMVFIGEVVIYVGLIWEVVVLVLMLFE